MARCRTPSYDVRAAGTPNVLAAAPPRFQRRGDSRRRRRCPTKLRELRSVLRRGRGHRGPSMFAKVVDDWASPELGCNRFRSSSRWPSSTFLRLENHGSSDTRLDVSQGVRRRQGARSNVRACPGPGAGLQRCQWTWPRPQPSWRQRPHAVRNHDDSRCSIAAEDREPIGGPHLGAMASTPRLGLRRSWPLAEDDKLSGVRH